MALLELRQVGKGIGVGGTRVEILCNVRLDVEAGEFVAIVGGSGSGKTTLLSLIAGLQAPDAGEIRLGGALIRGPGRERGLVFQGDSLLPWLTVSENVALGVDAVFGHWPAARRRGHVERHVALVSLAGARDRRPPQLSGGMRQRVAVARALALDPAILLLDEPFSALDALTRATLQGELEALWERDRKTVVLVTNDIDEAILLADRIVPLTSGPGATLSRELRVELPRPRDRKAINHDPRFREIRNQVIDSLLAARRGAMPSAHGREPDRMIPTVEASA